MTYENSLSFAQEQDRNDPLRDLRDRFLFPQHAGAPVIYFTGNSLGLQPKGVAGILQQEMDDWARYGVEGHFRAKHPWLDYHEIFSESLSRIVGARPDEVVAMNGLTINLHLLMVSFYRPSGRRTKILCEERPFPSDTYAMASQIAFHGLDPNEHLVEMKPREGEHTLRTEDITARIAELGDELALVLFGGVNFYTGQAFDLKAITTSGHAAGAQVGFDLAHAAGNVELHLHDDDVDFACWCSYKYMNSGPGGVAGIFVHERHFATGLPMFAGWWGHDKKDRFKMERTFRPIPTAEAWQLSNAPVFAMAPHRAALDLFDVAGMGPLLKKSALLTGFLEYIIDDTARSTGTQLEILTPRDPAQRGCQLSVVLHGKGRQLFDALTERGVMADWREPNVIRMAPVPLYNSFEDVWRFGSILKEVLT